MCGRYSLITPPSALLKPYSAEATTAHPVDPRVNTPRNDDADLLAPTKVGAAGDLFAAGRG